LAKKVGNEIPFDHRASSMRLLTKGNYFVSGGKRERQVQETNSRFPLQKTIRSDRDEQLVLDAFVDLELRMSLQVFPDGCL
jgi:hypothetical protein